MEESDFLKQVEAAIVFGEPAKLFALKKIALKNNFKNGKQLLNKALKDLKPPKKLSTIQEEASLISEDKKEKILDKYLIEGVPVKKIAIAFGIKTPVIAEIIDKNFGKRKKDPQFSLPISSLEKYIKENTSFQMLGPFRGDLERVLWRCKSGHKFEASPKVVRRRGENACPICSLPDSFTSKSLNNWTKLQRAQLQKNYNKQRFYGKMSPEDRGESTYERFIEKINKQLNLRLKDESQRQLSELHGYWKEKGNFKFLDVETKDMTIFNSPATFSKFILETALEHLNTDYENEKQIDLLALWISKKRIQIPEIKEKWHKLKNYRLEDWSLHSEELDDYIKNLNIWSKEELYNEAMADWVGINEEIFEIIWTVAIKRSHLIPDEIKEDRETDLDMKMRRLKDLYGTND